MIPRRWRLSEAPDALIAGTLALASLMAHWPIRTTLLFAWDSVLYTEALDGFDVGAHRPQPPGYLFYVWTVALARWLTGWSANDSLVLVSQLAGAATVGALFLVGRQLYDRTTGLLAALLAASSVAFSIYGGVAYPYTVLGLTSTVLGGLAWRVRQGQAPSWLLGLALGLLSGFRQDLLLFLGPLVLVSVGPLSWRRLVPAVLAGGVGLLCWLLPSAWLSHGLAAYVEALTAQSGRIERDTAVTAQGLAGLLANGRSLLRFSWQALGLAGLAAGAAALATTATRGGRTDRRAWHLALWAAPAILFYALIHIGDVGYVFSFMPAVWLAAAAGLAAAARPIARRWAAAGRPAGLAPAVLLAPIFLFNLWWLLVSAQPLSIAWLTCGDRALAQSVAQLQAHYPAGRAVLLTAGWYAQARYYAPEHVIWYYDNVNEPVTRRTVPPGHDRLVLVDWTVLVPPAAAPSASHDLGCGLVLRVYPVRPGDSVVIRGGRVAIGADAAP